MLDEFASIGVIGGDPKAFADTMSIVRSSRLDVQIIIQNLSQLTSMYGIDNADGIVACCATRLSLGVNDLKSAKFFSDLTGVATVLQDRHNESTTAINADSYLSPTSISGGKRQLLTPDEVMTFDKVLIIRQGQHPTSCLPFPHTKNPLYKSMQSQSIFSSITPIKIYEEAKKENKEMNIALIKKEIERLRKQNLALEEIEEISDEEETQIIEIESVDLLVEEKEKLMKIEPLEKKRKKQKPEIGKKKTYSEPGILDDD